MALPNEFERKLICQLRTSCRDVLKDMDVSDSNDMFFLRWLRARDYDMKRAEQMLRENRRWRKQHQVDRILEGGLDTYFKLNYPLHLGIFDRKSRPVVILPLGTWNLRMAASTGLSERFHLYVIQCMEAVMKSVEIRDSLRKPCAMPISQVTVIADFAGFDCSQLLNIRVLRTIQRTLTMLQSHYPETVAASLCINCPFVLTKCLQCVLARPAKKIMSPATAVALAAKRKFTHWCGKLDNEHDLRAVLRKFVPEGEEVTKCVYLLGTD